MKYLGILICHYSFILLPALLLFSGVTSAMDNAPKRLSEAYPGLATGILTESVLTSLPEDVLVRVGDKDITREMLARKRDGLSEDARARSENLLFYLLEEMVERPILLTLIMGDEELPKDNDAVQQLFKDYINEAIADIEVTEEEALAFYVSHSDMFGEAVYDEVKDEIKEKLFAKKQRIAWKTHVRRIGVHSPIHINASWLAEQAPKVKKNPVDKARASEKPALVVFSAGWSPACEQFQPILDSLIEADIPQLSILTIDIDSNGMLARRFDVSEIPALLFFDKTGKEVDRYYGYISGEKLVEKIKEITPSQAYDLSMND